MTLQQTERIHVCALRHIPEMVKQTGARHLVSAINADCLPVTPAAISRDRHLKLDMHDITELQPGTTLPSTEHVLELLDFVQSWDRQAPILIHCFAGLSRSTAAAFITLCALNPRAPEVAIAQALRRSSDTAIPNRLFVMLADKVLYREGRMVAALDSMGQNRIRMLSMALASLVLPFLPLAPLQILLNNLIYDLSEIGIPFDSADKEDLAKPRVWNPLTGRRGRVAKGNASARGACGTSAPTGAKMIAASRATGGMS